MSSYYVVKTRRGLRFFYHGENGGLMTRVMGQGSLSDVVCLLQKARSIFSATLDNEALHLFCQDEPGDIWLLTEREGRWNSRVVLKNSEMQVPDILITPLLTNRGLQILYNTVSGDPPMHTLVTRRTQDGGWSSVEQIDRIQPMGHALYEAQATAREHMLVFFQMRTSENILGYREITPTRFGVYNRFYNTTGVIADTAFLTTGNAVHVLFIVKTLFSCQLLYRRKVDAQFEAPTLLWEAPRIEQCLLTFVYGDLHATCMAGGQLYRAVSDNKGATFSRIALYKSKFCYEPVKAAFLSDEPQEEQKLYTRQVYVDRNAPWDMQMIPDLYPDFLDSEPVPETPPAPPASTDGDFQEQLLSAQRQLEEKDRQIMRLMYQLKTRVPDADVPG